MSQEFDVQRPSGRCAVSGRDIRPGESFFTALFETPQGFERRDYAPECWNGPPEAAFCAFRTRVAEKPARPRVWLDDESLIEFFRRLADRDEPVKQGFRFVLALMLMRKRVLKYEQTIREGDAETWQLRLMRDQSLHRVLNPRMSEEQIASVQEELRSILAGLSDESDAASPHPADDPAVYT